MSDKNNIYIMINNILEEYKNVYDNYNKYKKLYLSKLNETTKEDTSNSSSDNSFKKEDSSDIPNTENNNQNTHQNPQQNPSKHIVIDISDNNNNSNNNKNINGNQTSNQSNNQYNNNTSNQTSNPNSNKTENNTDDSSDINIIEYKIKFLKNMYKKIAVRTHPDKTKNQLYNKYFKLCKFYYENDILIGLISVSLKINIKIEFGNKHLSNIIFSEISQFKNYIFTMKNSHIYQWGIAL